MASPPSPALQAVQGRLGDIVESAMDAIVTIDARQRIVLFNAAASRMFGMRADVALGQPLETLVPLRSRAAHRGHVDRFAGSEGSARPMGAVRALTGRRADGSEFPIEASISRVGEGPGLLMTVMVREVTEVRDAERARQAHVAAEAANRAKNEFLARMSHELRTPLNVLLGMAELLQHSLTPSLDASQKRQFEALHASGEQLRNVIERVLDLSLIEAGDASAQLKEIDLCALLDAVLGQHAGLAAQHEVTLDAAYAAQRPCPMRVDPPRLRQAVSSLVSNAIRYNRPGGQVRVSLAHEPHGVRIAVADTGLGMDREQLASLYQPFNRLGRERSGVPGAGISLALTRHLVSLMGGSLRIDSTAQVGTTAEITLPAADRLGPPAGTVLYIEDNPVNALLVVEVLRQWPGVQVVVADTGTAGLQQARALKPDLVLLDMHLPDMTGLQVLAQLRADDATRHLLVAALSANAMPQDVAQALEAGACAYWTKPIEFASFLENMRRVLVERRCA
ncbi:MAG: response regulator [Rhizobacter sp.]|nr:response regulator [Rhizobacter sp.]